MKLSRIAYAAISSKSVNLTADMLCQPIKMMRIDNLLSEHGFCMRKETRQFLRNSMVESIDSVTNSKTRVLSPSEQINPSSIRLDGEQIPYAGIPLHFAMFKPIGYVCSHSLDEFSENGPNKSVYELLPSEFLMRNPVLSSVGRLDKDSSGLLLFTQNGQLLNRLISSSKCMKEYLVSLRDPLSREGKEVSMFQSGTIELVDGHVAKPCLLQPHLKNPRVCKVTLSEGRFHQIRRMFAAIGHSVTGIHRVAFGGLSLSSLGLQSPGSHVPLTRDHLATLLENSAPTSSGSGKSLRLSNEIPQVGRRIIRVREQQVRREYDDAENDDEEEREEYEESEELNERKLFYFY
jgi:16S rRNA pseudouridine516 synthase